MDLVGDPVTGTGKPGTPSAWEDRSMSTATQSRILTTSDVCELFRITKHTLTRWVRTGVFPRPFAPGKGKCFWLAEDVAAVFERRHGGK
jgi:predicted DNA-binding transcriptional regulator AlpA